MFSTILIFSFIATIAAILLHFLIFWPKLGDVFGKDRSLKILDPLRVVILFFTALFIEQKWNFIGSLRKLIFLLALLCFAVLIVTGFVPRIFWDSAITGYWLSVHATAAPVFAACLALLTILWADNNRFDKNYIPLLNRLLSRQPKSTIAPRKCELCLKISFWCVMVLAIPVILSAVLSMFPIFGTHGQEMLLQIHRYSTLLLSLFGIIYLYLAGLNEMEKTAAG
jgi:hypothetical protein